MALPASAGSSPASCEGLGLVEVDPPVGDLAVAEGDHVGVAGLDLEVVPFALAVRVEEGDDPVAGGEQPEVADLDVVEAAISISITRPTASRPR